MTKEKLLEYMWLKKSTKQLEERIEEIDTLLTRTTRSLSDMPRNKSPKDLTNDLLARKIDLQRQLEREVNHCLVELEAIDRAISKLPHREQYLFRMRYIEGRKWEDICLKLDYSERQCYRIHGEALKKQGWA